MLKTLLGAGALSAVLLGAGASSASADTSVNPQPPTFLDTCGSANDTYLIPNTPNVSYYVGGVKMNPGTRHIDPASPAVSIFPVANSGHTLTQTSPWSYTFNTGSGESDTGCAAKETSTASPSASASGSSSAAAPATKTVGPSSGPTKRAVNTMPRTGIDSTEMLAGAGIAALAGFSALGASARLGKRN